MVALFLAIFFLTSTFFFVLNWPETRAKHNYWRTLIFCGLFLSLLVLISVVSLVFWDTSKKMMALDIEALCFQTESNLHLQNNRKLLLSTLTSHRAKPLLFSLF